MNSKAIERLGELLMLEKYNDVIRGAKTLLHSESKAVASDASKLTGLSLFHQRKFEEALPFLIKVTEYQPDVRDWLNVVTTSTLTKKIEAGRTAFERAIQLQRQTGQQPSTQQICHYYACALRDAGEFTLALEQLNLLRTVYEELKITDPHFLQARSVPFLSHTIDVAIDVFNGLGPSFDGKKWLNDFSSKLDTEGQAYANNKIQLLSS